MTPTEPGAREAARVEAEIAARHVRRRCSCKGRRWTDDENWQQEDPRSPVERTHGDGLIPCGSCNLGGWDTPEWQPDDRCDDDDQEWPCDVRRLLSRLAAPSEPSGTVTPEPPGVGCPHGRSGGAPCPWCLGINMPVSIANPLPVHREDGHLWTECPACPGWTAAADSFTDLYRLTSEHHAGLDHGWALFDIWPDPALSRPPVTPDPGLRTALETAWSIIEANPTEDQCRHLRYVEECDGSPDDDHCIDRGRRDAIRAALAASPVVGTGLDVAWETAERALPEDGSMRIDLLAWPTEDDDEWVVRATGAGRIVKATGPTPTAALEALRATLTDRPAESEEAS